MKHDPLIEILKTEFHQKKVRNKSYSLRSYARDLGMDPSNLSKLINYKMAVGPFLRSKIAKKLGFQDTEIQKMLKSSNPHVGTDVDYLELDIDVFQIVSEWQHFAILEVFKIKNVPSEPNAIAAHLGLQTQDVADSIERLLQAGLLEKNSKGIIAPAHESTSSILNTATSTAHRNQQRQILEGAIDALNNTPIEYRSQSSITMAIDSNKIDEAKKLIKTFRRSLGRLMTTAGGFDSVYQLSISMYPVTKPENIKGKAK